MDVYKNKRKDMKVTISGRNDGLNVYIIHMYTSVHRGRALRLKWLMETAHTFFVSVIKLFIPGFNIIKCDSASNIISKNDSMSSMIVQPTFSYQYDIIICMSATNLMEQIFPDRLCPWNQFMNVSAFHRDHQTIFEASLYFHPHLLSWHWSPHQ